MCHKLHQLHWMTDGAGQVVGEKGRMGQTILELVVLTGDFLS